eukprot:Gb_11164 [translate_table: standard]
MYIDGLKDFLRGYVKALKPNTLVEAIQQAEAYSEVAKRQLKRRMVGPAIIVDLHLKTLCFNCKEKWSKGHKFKTLGKIHMIEILNEEHPMVVESDQEELMGANEEIANNEDQE